ncbi:molecular chaperone [Pseudomonas sp. RW3S2]|uniref:fimbrial biogenesis chaperone n=1 Tax=Pseudomonas sp. RW3S2 TaxID=485884 RepID=UPI00164421CC|nr:molecular chaperone [Pseudomonas sp. RW3S2]MBC3423639.1 molecular chaperone [Pseudomonas sp. RW3S2]
MKLSLSTLGCAALLAACFVCAPASASVVIATTRVIYPAESPEVTVRLSNEGRHPSLVQVWVDEGGPEDPEGELQGPFSLTPPLFRLDPGKRQSLRLFHDGRRMPEDRESLYWLNVLDVPPKGGGGNSLQISLRTRIKLFYRPQGLAGKAEQAHAQVTWRLVKDAQGWALQADNPTQYHVNLAVLEVARPDSTLAAEVGHIPPRDSARFALQVAPSGLGPVSEVRYQYLDDYGALQKATSVVQPFNGPLVP